MPDAYEPAGQHVLQESSQKLRRGEGHGTLLVAVGVVLPAESNLLAIKGEQSVIADRDPVNVAPKVSSDHTRTAHRRLGVDHPILGKERVDEGLKTPRIG